MDGERIPGSGITHEQNYIEERLINASHVDELGEQNEKLKDELRDLQTEEPSRDNASSSDAVLEDVVNAPTMQSELASEARTNTSVGPVDVEKLPPVASARSEVVRDSGG